ncbi:hypothetical protein DPX16_10829 [Anabarilius grahami]|uniref:Uncharacterized protein n=1 Tax=Anabarilius grahami TaxID=495550 RepID=A0A3N0Z7G4_ANAGA|nr:hypothetical protein DPX16_10829 [Anabarilius grahami]
MGSVSRKICTKKHHKALQSSQTRQEQMPESGEDPRDLAYGKFMSLMSQQLENVDTLLLNGMQDAFLQQSSMLFVSSSSHSSTGTGFDSASKHCDNNHQTRPRFTSLTVTRRVIIVVKVVHGQCSMEMQRGVRERWSHGNRAKCSFSTCSAAGWTHRSEKKATGYIQLKGKRYCPNSPMVAGDCRYCFLKPQKTVKTKRYVSSMAY